MTSGGFLFVVDTRGGGVWRCTPERALQGVVYQIVQRMSTPGPGIFGVVRPGQGTAPS